MEAFELVEMELIMATVVAVGAAILEVAVELRSIFLQEWDIRLLIILKPESQEILTGRIQNTTPIRCSESGHSPIIILEETSI